jgi:hypothetical protein
MDTPENIEEFCTITNLLVDADLSVLHEVLKCKNEEEQHKCLRYHRNYRNNIIYYATLYNALTASRSLVSNPILYVTNEIVTRFNKFNLNL